MQEEREEKALRTAEMEATKAENMMTYEGAIMSRPKRSWFMSERDKAAVARAAKAVEAPGGDKEGKGAKGKGTSKAEKEAKRAEAKGVHLPCAAATDVHRPS